MADTATRTGVAEELAHAQRIMEGGNGASAVRSRRRLAQSTPAAHAAPAVGVPMVEVPR